MPFIKFLLSIHYIIWLVASAVFFAFGEFFSKKFALHPKAGTVGIILVAYIAGTLMWLPAILQKKQLSIAGAIWSVMSLLATVLIGLVLFDEKLSALGMVGIIVAFAAVILLSLA